MIKFIQLTQDEYDQVLAFVGQDYKELVQFVHSHRVCVVSSILKKFPDLEDDLEVLKKIGTVNGSLWKKFKAAIHPVEITPNISDSAYSLGVMVEEE